MVRQRDSGDYVEFSDCDVGIESKSGLAVSLSLDGGSTWHWIPLSQVEEIHRDPRVHNHDRIKMSRWIANEKGLV